MTPIVLQPPAVTENVKVPPEPHFLQSKQLQLPQLCLTGLSLYTVHQKGNEASERYRISLLRSSGRSMNLKEL